EHVTTGWHLGGGWWFWTGVILANMGVGRGHAGFGRVPESGGELSLVTFPDTLHGEGARVSPLLAGDGRTVVFAMMPQTEGAKAGCLQLTSIDGGPAVDLGVAGAYPLGFVDDKLIYTCAD